MTKHPSTYPTQSCGMLTNETPQASANRNFDWATSELVWNNNQVSNQTISEFMADYWINNQKYKIAPWQKTTIFRPPSSPDTSPEWPTATTSRAEPEPESEEIISQEETSEYESDDDDDDMATITPKEIWINTSRHSMETEMTSTSSSSPAVHTSISTPRSSTPTRRRFSSYSHTWLKEQQKHGKKSTWTKRSELMDFTPLSSPNSRKCSQQLIPKVKHGPSYDNSGKAKMVLTNTLHSSESYQDEPNSQMTRHLLSTS